MTLDTFAPVAKITTTYVPSEYPLSETDNAKAKQQSKRHSFQKTEVRLKPKRKIKISLRPRLQLLLFTIESIKKMTSFKLSPKEIFKYSF